MRRRTLLIAVVGVSCAVWSALHGLQAQQPTPDLILSNGKIITVDERFTIAQAMAVRGDRIVAVGSNQDVTRLAGPDTKRIDLSGRAVTPGLIDNHMHLLRGGTTWQWEVRWDGVASRKQALEMLRARATVVAPGEWIYNLGGWAIEQFADDKRPFTREELDQVVPDHPVLLQASYREAYLNSRALQTLGVSRTPPRIRRSCATRPGKPTGRILEAGFRQLVAKTSHGERGRDRASTRAMIRDLNKMGLTAFGSAGCEADVLPTYRKLADQGQLNVRVFCITVAGRRSTGDQLLPSIAQMKLFQGDNYIDQIFYGESVYGPLHDPMFLVKSDPKPEQLAQWRRIATEIAKAGLPLHVHANLTNTIDGVPRSDRADQQGVSDQEPALGAGPRRSAQRLASRAHEEAGDVRRGPSLGRHQGRRSIRRSSATPRTTCRRCGRFRTAASCGASAATAPGPIRSCPSRPCRGR